MGFTRSNARAEGPLRPKGLRAGRLARQRREVPTPCGACPRPEQAPAGQQVARRGCPALCLPQARETPSRRCAARFRGSAGRSRGSPRHNPCAIRRAPLAFDITPVVGLAATARRVTRPGKPSGPDRSAQEQRQTKGAGRIAFVYRFSLELGQPNPSEPRPSGPRHTWFRSSRKSWQPHH